MKRASYSASCARAEATFASDSASAILELLRDGIASRRAIRWLHLPLAVLDLLLLLLLELGDDAPGVDDVRMLVGIAPQHVVQVLLQRLKARRRSRGRRSPPQEAGRPGACADPRTIQPLRARVSWRRGTAPPPEHPGWALLICSEERRHPREEVATVGVHQPHVAKLELLHAVLRLRELLLVGLDLVLDEAPRRVGVLARIARGSTPRTSTRGSAPTRRAFSGWGSRYVTM